MFSLSTDIDECKAKVCKDEQTCLNTFGSFECIDNKKCKTGLKKNPTTGKCEGNDETILHVDSLDVWLIN